MVKSADFQTAVRGLHLPTAAGREGELVERVAARLDALNIQAQDRAQWLRAEQATWREAGVPSAEFVELVTGILFEGGGDGASISVPFSSSDDIVAAARKLARTYFSLQRRLVDEHLLGFEQARQLLSYGGLILRMRLDDHMSASEIARWLAAADMRLPLNWRAVQLVLQLARVRPQLSAACVEATFEADIQAESELFGDQTEENVIEMIAGVARDLGVTRINSGHIQDLVSGHPPYLQILHYQLTIQAHFDHALSYLYEFAPRGVAAKWLTKRYQAAGIEVGGSPILNNAKAVDQADANWVASRDANQREAKALSSILLGLESLGASAKSELAMIIRRFLCRIIRLRQEEGRALRDELPDCNPEQTKHVLGALAAGNSETYGILEQRALEALIEAERPASKFHGMGDSVFATNTHRKKLGDFEAQSYTAHPPSIDAYEAHGGRLSRHYVDDHLRTYAKVLSGRVDDLVAVASLGDWRLRVIFVSHGIDADLAGLRQVHLTNGSTVEVQVETATYADIIARAGDISESWNRRVVDKMNSTLVPARFRERVLDLMRDGAA